MISAEHSYRIAILGGDGIGALAGRSSCWATEREGSHQGTGLAGGDSPQGTPTWKQEEHSDWSCDQVVDDQASCRREPVVERVVETVQ